MSQEATIRRGVRNARYAAIPNHVFEDARLSMEARWLLGYLLSKPDNWTVVIGDIIKKGNCGRDKARKMIAELVDSGYAEREQQRADGKFGASVLVIFDEPRADRSPENEASEESVAFLPQTDLPATAKPSPASPSPVKSAHSNNSPLENTDSQPLREGVHEVREGAIEPQAGEPAETAASIERAFWRLVKNWPDFDGMPKEPAKGPWLALTPTERSDALAMLPEWLAALKRQRKSHVPAPSTYLREKLWEDISEAVVHAATPPAPCNPFSKGWMGLRLSILLGPEQPLPRMPALLEALVKAGGPVADRERKAHRQRHAWPQVNRMHEDARQRRGALVPASLAALAEGFRSYHVQSPTVAAWRTLHDQLGWAWPDLGTAEWICLPETDGDTLDAAMVALELFKERLSEVRGDEHAA